MSDKKEPIEFVRAIANKEILTKLLTPAERHIFSQAVYDYEDALKLLETLNVENKRCKEIAERDGKDYSDLKKICEELAGAMLKISVNVENGENHRIKELCEIALESYRKWKGE